MSDISDYNFFFVASKVRLKDGTPQMRERRATEEEAVALAQKWAANSEHSGPYIVFRCVAVGEAQKVTPPVVYNRFSGYRV